MGLTAEQHAQRRTLITASDVASIVGVNPWSSAHDVYMAKTSDDPPWAGNFRTRKGEALEPLGIAWAAEHLAPLVVRPAGTVTLTHPILTWLGATPDALVFARIATPGDPVLRAADKPSAVVEVKTAGPRTSADWDDADGAPVVPDYYAIQVAVQMIVTVTKRAHVVAMLDTEDEPRMYEMEHDEELATEILETCDDFRRRHLEPRVPPPVDGSDGARRMVRRLFRRATSAAMVQATPDAEDVARAYLHAKAQAAKYKDDMAVCEAHMCSLIGDARGLVGDGWRAVWSNVEAGWVERFERKAHRRFDLRPVTRKEPTP